MISRFEEVSPQLIGAVRAGVTLDLACRQAGISVHTAKDWARRGRREPDGRFAGFARALAESRGSLWGDEGDLSWPEYERHLAKAIRGGSVQAMRIYATLHRPDEAPAEDDFSRFDELARRRA